MYLFIAVNDLPRRGVQDIISAVGQEATSMSRPRGYLVSPWSVMFGNSEHLLGIQKVLSKVQE
jgi:hypothetical protein